MITLIPTIATSTLLPTDRCCPYFSSLLYYIICCCLPLSMLSCSRCWCPPCCWCTWSPAVLYWFPSCCYPAGVVFSSLLSVVLVLASVTPALLYHCTAASGIDILLLLMVSVKSVLLGLHSWLPDAMEGPTSVSAVIHACTLVVAGVLYISKLLLSSWSCHCYCAHYS